MSKITLYPRLVPDVAINFLDKQDCAVLEALVQSEHPEDDGTIDAVMVAKVLKVGRDGFMIDDTGCDFAKPFRKLIVQKWREAGAGAGLISIIKAGQRQNAKQVLFTPGGMWPEPREATKLNKMGRETPKKKTVRKMLKSLVLMHNDLWPIEQLANVVNPCLRGTFKKRK